MNSTTAMSSSNFDYDDDGFIVAPSTLKWIGIANVTMGSLGAFLSLVLAIATGLPLWIAAKRKKYSSFNLYLSFLSISDCFMAASVIYFAVRHTPWNRNQQREDDPLWFVDSRSDDTVGPVCATANMYLNAFLTNEIYRMLLFSSLRKRYRPPTISRVAKQASASFGISLSVFLIDYFAVAHRFDDVDDTSENWIRYLNLAYQTLVLIVCAGIPLTVLVVLSIRIWWKGLIGSTSSLYGGRMRILTLFFVRVVLLDLVVWIPTVIGFSAPWIFTDPETQILAYWGSYLIVGTSFLVNFGLSLTKADTRQLVTDLLESVVCCRPYYTTATATSSTASDRTNRFSRNTNSSGDDFHDDSNHNHDGERYDYFLGRLESVGRRVSGLLSTGLANHHGGRPPSSSSGIVLPLQQTEASGVEETGTTTTTPAKTTTTI